MTITEVIRRLRGSATPNALLIRWNPVEEAVTARLYLRGEVVEVYMTGECLDYGAKDLFSEQLAVMFEKVNWRKQRPKRRRK